VLRIKLPLSLYRVLTKIDSKHQLWNMNYKKIFLWYREQSEYALKSLCSNSRKF
jgi:hypothetical protein